jgi:hypothetical protein
MKYLLWLLAGLHLTIGLNAQDKVDRDTEAKIIEEGTKLYKIELASWYGTDCFLKLSKDKSQKAGGYFSYADNGQTKCIFFTNENTPKVLATISFDDTFAIDKAKVDSLERELLPIENDLYIIRQKALAQIRTDTLYKTYKNTSLNLIPLIEENSKKVYVLTGPKVNGVVIFGNDYLLTFNDAGGLVSTKKLHKSIIPIEYTASSDKAVTMHSHLPETGDYITASDVCTLLLYEKFANWKQHYVISNNYVSIWDCESNDLVILTKEAWDKISNHQKEMKKRRKE